MLKMICGFARALAILLAIIAGFVALGTMDTALVLVVLGLVAGLAMAKEDMLLAAATVIALPIIGTALGHLPAVGAQLAAVTGNLQLAIAGAFASALAIRLYHLVMEGLVGLGGAAAGANAAAAPAR